MVDAGRQRCEAAHVRVWDPLAHILLLQIRTLLQIIVINSPWEDSTELMKQRQREKDRASENIAV